MQRVLRQGTGLAAGNAPVDEVGQKVAAKLDAGALEVFPIAVAVAIGAGLIAGAGLCIRPGFRRQ